MNEIEAIELDEGHYQFAGEAQGSHSNGRAELQRSGTPPIHFHGGLGGHRIQFWRLGLVGARLDELMQSRSGCVLPVMATYRPSTPRAGRRRAVSERTGEGWR